MVGRFGMMGFLAKGMVIAEAWGRAVQGVPWLCWFGRLIWEDRVREEFVETLSARVGNRMGRHNPELSWRLFLWVRLRDRKKWGSWSPRLQVWMRREGFVGDTGKQELPRLA